MFAIIAINQEKIGEIYKVGSFVPCNPRNMTFISFKINRIELHHSKKKKNIIYLALILYLVQGI